MLVRPDRQDLRIIGFYTSQVMTGLGLVMFVPSLLGLIRWEINDALGLLIGACLALVIGQLGAWRLRTRRDLSWSHGMSVVALSWLLAAFIGAMPLFLSGHYVRFLDAYFDAMSGFATAGLAVINDLDHVSDSINLWRHLMQFMGGQGLILVALSLFRGGGGLTGLYVGEGREERILPHVAQTAQFIWRVALLYAALGTIALWAALLHAGMPLVEGGLHALMLFMAAFDTGGFAPTAASLGFYHSRVVEAVASVLMVAGMLSFTVHYHLFSQRQRELWRNTEVRFLALSIVGMFAVAAAGLARSDMYSDAVGMFRRGFFQLVSAHTGTGFATIPGRLFVTDWGVLAPAMIVFAMALGGMAGSTTGGIKAVRVVLVYKALQADLRRLLLPRDAKTLEAYYGNNQRRIVDNGAVRGALLVFLLYLLLYAAGAMLGLFYGYSLQESLFESTSAAAAVGLSIGIVGPDVETPLKVMYIFQMWIGRLEFISVFTLFGYLYSTVRGRL